MSHNDPQSSSSLAATPRRRRILLWVVAVLLMLASAVYQRRTGPTRPLRGSIEVAGQELDYRLIRTDWSNRTNEAARVTLPGTAGDGGGATLHYRRFRMEEPFTSLDMQRELDGEDALLVGLLPAQPSAGKLEYFLTVEDGGATHRIPREEGETAVIRFKDHVPIWILLPHILFMFFAVLFGMRAGLGALFGATGMQRQAWIAFGGMTIGGMVLGPIVQKHAFGAYWTGFPWGGDWTDNKMLIMWIVWIIACGTFLLGERLRPAVPRVVVMIASLAMTAVYLIPHSTRGSELDYSQVDQGVDPEEAIETGR